jgi:excinuclease UvrABC nuclease subunit
VLYFGEQQVLIMQVRRGLVNAFTLDQVIETSADLFLRARYGSSSPRQLIVNQVGSREELEQALGAATGQHVRVTIPRRGQAANALLKLCAMNYAYRTAHQEGRTRGPDSSTVSESPR